MADTAADMEIETRDRAPVEDGCCDICGGLGEYYDGAAATLAKLGVARCFRCADAVESVRCGFSRSGPGSLCVRERDAGVAVAALAPTAWARFEQALRAKGFDSNARPGADVPPVFLWLGRVLQAVGGAEVQRVEQERKMDELMSLWARRIRRTRVAVQTRTMGGNAHQPRLCFRH